MIESQGCYQGYFAYDGRRVHEKFSILLRKALEQPSKANSIEVVGFGQNDEMGTFTLQGSIELFSTQKLKEKEMANQTMKRLKLAKFTLTKSYVTKTLK